MLHRVFGFADLTAGQMMVPRTELVAVAGRRDARRGRRADHALRPHPAAGLPRGPRPRHRHAARHRSAEGDRRAAARSNAAALAREALTVPETLGADDLLVGNAPPRRARGDGHRRVRRHRRAGHVRIADGADRRRPGDARRRPRRGSNCSRTDRPTSTGSTLVTDVNERFGLHIDETTYTTVGGYVLGRLGRRAARRRHDRRRTDAGCASRRSTGCAWRRCGCRNREGAPPRRTAGGPMPAERRSAVPQRTRGHEAESLSPRTSALSRRAAAAARWRSR